MAHSIPAKTFLLLTCIIMTSLSVLGADIRDYLNPDEVQALSNVSSLRLTGTITMSGMTGTFERVFATPNRTYAYFDLGIIQFSQGYDGKTAWAKDQNQQVMALTGLDLRKIINEVYIFGGAYAIDGRMPGRVTYQKDTLINDVVYHTFFIMPEGGDSLWVLINDETHRIEITKEYLDELVIYSYSSDFRTVEGMDLAFTVKAEASNALMSYTMTVSSAEVNETIDPALFVMQSVETVDYRFPDDVDSVIVPVQYHRGHLSIDATIGGLTRRFLLDTGAGMNILDEKFASDLKLEATGSIPAKGVSGYDTTAITDIDTLVVSSLALVHQKASVLDFGGLDLGVPGEFGGILGYDFLSRLPFRVDYNMPQIVFYHPERFRAPDTAAAIDFELFMKTPTIGAILDNCPGRYLIDLGNSQGLILHGDYVDDCELADRLTDHQEVAGVGGVGGTSEAYAAVGHQLVLGTVIVKTVPLLVATGESGIVRSTEVDANIGNLLLEKFSPLFNYSERTLYLLPK
ncbi:MAG: clan AA aspartic protease [candidate division Zixibacteria bacterium]|nr:clan AA aspartic protease [candidate division Zixibacteria bacterium]